MIPPAGPAPGAMSGTTRRRAGRAARSPPTNTTGSHPASRQRARHPRRHRDAVDLDQRLVGAHPCARSAREHRTGQTHDRQSHEAQWSGCPTGRAGAGTRGIAPPRRSHRSRRPSHRARAASAGNPGSSARPSARSRSPANRWPAACRGHGGSRPGTRRSARSCRDRDRRAPPRRRGSAATPRRPRRPRLDVPPRRSPVRPPRRRHRWPRRRAAPWWGGPWTCGSGGRSRRAAYRVDAGRMPGRVPATAARGRPIRVRPCSDSASTKRRTSR